ncbi:MAG: fibrillarin-like rRNA/tRNA 2'-O-methyltransferase [Candidatus Marsarchaeota archaeon]|nr:fibrillarin-like rRNA/tRNA 2'-O-methyltransferase [Candidatus Marsarchaeota archaeon]
MQITQVFKGVFRIDGKLATLNLVPGARVYGEELKTVQGAEYRMWNPYRSKLAAAILNGMKTMAITEGSEVLYLGAANGTTCSHVSDIVGGSGSVYCVEVSKRSMRDLLDLCDARENMLPIFTDARYIDEYKDDVGTVDVLYQDVSAQEQADILLKNSALLDSEGIAYVAIKSQSIDITRKPEEIFEEFIDAVSDEFSVIERIRLEPYDKMHLFVVFRKRR